MAKMTLNELKLEIASILEEAKKQDKKEEDLEKKGHSIEAYGLYDEAFDYAQPLGALNLYAQQGAVNWGPYTSAGPTIDSSYADPQRNNATANLKESDERALRSLVREIIENGLIPAGSAWAPLLRRERADEGAWGAAGELLEKHIGFAKLKGQLAHKKGIHDPGALAASIGRKKYGSHAMAKKSAAGRKHHHEGLDEAWYDRDQKSSESPVKRGKGIDHAKEYGPVQKHGMPPKKKK